MDSLETIFDTTKNEIGERFFTDKGLPYHSYISFYDNELAIFRKNVKLLEIGVSWGGSLLLWSKYFKKYKLEGLDITDTFINTPDNPNKAIFEADNNINLHLNVNSTDKSYADSTFKNGYFDVIIEDGAHDVPTQIETFKTYFSKLSKNGAYYIEDVLGDKAVKDLMEQINTFTNNGVSFDLFEGKIGRFDDIILKIVRK